MPACRARLFFCPYPRGVEADAADVAVDLFEYVVLVVVLMRQELARCLPLSSPFSQAVGGEALGCGELSTAIDLWFVRIMVVAINAALESGPVVLYFTLILLICGLLPADSLH